MTLKETDFMVENIFRFLVKPPRPEGRGFCLAAVLRSPVRKINIFI
jgi:hypothetical protein